MMHETSVKIAETVKREKKLLCKTVLVSISVIGMVAISWAMSTQFSKTALIIDPTHFYAPYAMMWFNTNFMMLCYPVFLCYEIISSRSWRKAHEDSSSIFGEGSIKPKSVFFKVGPFLLFWIGANYTYAASLLYISASMATSISSCNAAMVYMLAILLLGDKFMPIKLLSVGFAVAGVFVLSLGGEIKVKWQGIALSVCSAASAALYKVLFKRLLGNANLGQVSLFMTCLGFLNLIFNWIPALILLLTNVEHVEISYIPWAPVIGTALLSLVFNFVINFGIALLHPLVISVGMLMGIPLNTVIDVLFRGVVATANFIGGTVLIIISFVFIILPYELLCQSKSTNNAPPEQNSGNIDENLSGHVLQVITDNGNHKEIKDEEENKNKMEKQDVEA